MTTPIPFIALLVRRPRASSAPRERTGTLNDSSHQGTVCHRGSFDGKELGQAQQSISRLRRGCNPPEVRFDKTKHDRCNAAHAAARSSGNKGGNLPASGALMKKRAPGRRVAFPVQKGTYVVVRERAGAGEAYIEKVSRRRERTNVLKVGRQRVA